MALDIGTLALEVIPSVVANALTTFLPKLGRILGGAHRPETRLSQSVAADESVRSVIQKATAAVARQRSLVEEPKKRLLQQFLVSPELDAMIKQIYSSRLAEDGKAYLGDIRKEFETSLRLHLNLSATELSELSPALFSAILQACDQALDKAVGQKNFAAADAKSAARYNVLIEQLESVRRNLELLNSRPQINIAEILRFEERYKLVAQRRHGYITLPNLSAAQKVPLDEIYVPNNFVPNSSVMQSVLSPQFEEHFFARAAVGTDQLLRLLDRTVVLGNPGAGKSTLSQYICHKLSIADDLKQIQRVSTPLLVVLRDYGAEKKQRPCSIVDFINSTINSKYQLKPPEGAIEYLLLNGRVLVIFDGLDELLDTSYRSEIAGDVESFCTIYPSAAVLVTSREVGYDQAPLSPEKFSTFRITEFDDDQIQQYVEKRFAADEDLNAHQKRSLARSFLEESASVPDLRSNPLMLGLMCTIYRGEMYIPRNRPGVYQKCALMLFERWDKSRQIDVRITFEDRLGPVMMYLAYWIYADPKLQTGVTENRLVEKATEYLHNRYFEDIDVARRTARDFIEFCRGRAWVFTDTGSTAEGEPLYQFTHRTFLEYFTAAHLVRTHATPDDLGATLIPRIQRREWDIVAQLAFQLQNTNIEGAADRLIELLVLSGQALPQAEIHLLSFGVRALAFLIPSPKVVRSLANEALRLCINTAATLYRQDYELVHSPSAGAAQELLVALIAVAPENRVTVADVLQTHAGRIFPARETVETIAAFDVIRYLANPIVLQRLSQVRITQETTDAWESIRASVLSHNAEHILEVAAKSAYFARCCYHAALASAAEITFWHGLDVLYQLTRSLVYSVQFPPIVDCMLKPKTTDSRKTSAQQLARLGQALITMPLPWARSATVGRFSRVRFPRYHRIASQKRLVGDLLFAVFVVFAVFLEAAAEKQTISDAIKFIRKTRNPQIVAIREVLLFRFDHKEEPTATAMINVSPEQQRIVSGWQMKKISFIGPRTFSAHE